jgi:hypothetical protein
MMRSMRHENIVSYFGCERTTDMLRIFMELVPGGVPFFASFSALCSSRFGGA